VLLAALLFISVFVSGCSNAESGFLSLNNEILNLSVYETTLSMSMALNKVPSATPDNGGAMAQSLINALLTRYSLYMDEKVDTDKDVATCSFSLLDKVTRQKQEITQCIFSGETVYANVAELEQALEQFGVPNIGDLKKFLNGATWISISQKDFERMMPQPPGAVPGFNAPNPIPGLNAPPNFSIAQNKKRSLILYRLLNALSQTSLQQYSSDVITQQGSNSYTVNIDPRGAANLVRSLGTYAVNHSDQIGEALKSFLQGLSADDLAAWNLTDQQRRDMLTGIDQMVADVSANHDKYLASLSNPDLSFLGNSSLTMALTKTGPGAYRQGIGLNLDIVPPDQPSDEFSFSYTIDSTARVIPSFQVDVPSQGVVSLTQLQAKIQATMPLAMNVFIKSKYYTVNKGFLGGQGGGGAIDSRIIGGHVYLPLRTVAEALGESVNWDPVSRRAYIVHNGQPIFMTGVIVGGHFYVKIGDFEQLGYQVEWNPHAQMVTIIKQPPQIAPPHSTSATMASW
jgi:hypothetical protein